MDIDFISEIPARDKVNAVFLIGFIDGLLVCTQNERGWDIPSGHVEAEDQDLLSALNRECREEAGVAVSAAIPFATFGFGEGKKRMVFYASGNCRWGEFTPADDALDGSLMPVEVFLATYHGDGRVMEVLIEKALEVIERKAGSA